MANESEFSLHLRGLKIVGPEIGSLLVGEEKISLLIPSYRDDELAIVVAMIPRLIGVGCVDICFFGPNARKFHDEIDAVLESRGMFDVVTSCDENFDDACDYFLFASCGGKGKLLAMISGYDDLVVSLLAKVASLGSA